VWALAAEARVSGGPLPGLAWGAGVGVDVTRGRLRGSLRALGWLPSEDGVAGTSARARFSAAGAAAALCGAALRTGRLTIAACAEANGAAVFGGSSGGLTSRSVTAPWYAAGLGVRARVRLLRALHLEIGGGAAASVTRPRFEVTYQLDTGMAERVVYTVSRVVPAATLGFSLDI
jgi:hypothetical protein